MRNQPQNKMLNLEVVQNKIADIEEQMEIIRTTDDVVMVGGDSGGKMSKEEMLEFQQGRIDLLEELSDKSYEEVKEAAAFLLAEALETPDQNTRASLYLHLLAIGLSSVDEFLFELARSE